MLNGLAALPTDPVARDGAEGPPPADVLHLLDRTAITLLAGGAAGVRELTGGLYAEGPAVRAIGESIQGAAHETATSVRHALDLRGHARRHPWGVMAGAVAVGFACGRWSRP